jgi:hypothetical protein
MSEQSAARSLPVRIKVGTLITRLQAKRVSHRFERFKPAELAFADISEIVQPFVYELFRAFATAHWRICIAMTRAKLALVKMIQRAAAARAARAGDFAA